MCKLPRLANMLASYPLALSLFTNFSAFTFSPNAPATVKYNPNLLVPVSLTGAELSEVELAEFTFEEGLEAVDWRAGLR